jgi:hypothetical protein
MILENPDPIVPLKTASELICLRLNEGLRKKMKVIL